MELLAVTWTFYIWSCLLYRFIWVSYESLNKKSKSSDIVWTRRSDVKTKLFEFFTNKLVFTNLQHEKESYNRFYSILLILKSCWSFKRFGGYKPGSENVWSFYFFLNASLMRLVSSSHICYLLYLDLKIHLAETNAYLK